MNVSCPEAKQGVNHDRASPNHQHCYYVKLFGSASKDSFEILDETLVVVFNDTSYYSYRAEQ